MIAYRQCKGDRDSKGLRFPAGRLARSVVTGLVCIALLYVFAVSRAQSTHLNAYMGIPVPQVSQLPFASTEEAHVVVKRILDAVGLHSNFEITESLNTSVAVAFLDDDGERWIGYNPVFMKEAAENDWTKIAILAHEIGHHLNFHLPVRPGADRHELELQADHFAGLALALLGATLEQAQSAVRDHTDSAATAEHPAANDRLQAIALGWRTGSSRGTDRDILAPHQVDEFIRRAQAGGVIHLGAGTFVLPRGLQLRNSVEIIGAGQDATIVHGNNGLDGWVLHFANEAGTFRLRDLTVRAAGRSTHDVVTIARGTFAIDQVTLQGAGTGSFHTGGGGHGLMVLLNSEGTISNSYIHKNQSYGVLVNGQASLTMLRNIVTDNGGGIYYGENSGGVVSGNRITDPHYIGPFSFASLAADNDLYTERQQTWFPLEHHLKVVIPPPDQGPE